MISLSGIGKKYKGSKYAALSDVTLEIEEGEFIIVTGPVSSGKSTLMKVLACEERIDSGEYWLLGVNMKLLKRAELRRLKCAQIGYASVESDTLLYDLTVKENLLAKIAYFREDAEDFVEEMATRFGITKLLGRAVKGLSKGERMLVSLVLAIIHMPKVVVLDEPFLFFDHPLSVKIMSIVQEFSLDHQITTIIAERDVRLHPFAHRLVRLKEGGIYDILGEAVVGNTPPFMQI